MIRLIATDACTADTNVKPASLLVQIVSARVFVREFVREDSIVSGGEVLFRRIDAVGLGDVHWESLLTGERFTNIWIEPVDV